MPEGATVAEREAELIALQAAFDEYIASSRELEDELDAELAKMQEKVAESTAANSALSAQLENISPQLASLETALTTSRQKLKEEQKLRRVAEQSQDEADQRLRELEQSLQTLREECDDVHEELAFKESELEETRLELEVEKQQLENDLTKMRHELAEALRHKARESSLLSATTTMETDASAESIDDAYVKKLEEELELVTEQLIETEKRLTDAEAELQESENLITSLQKEGDVRESEGEDIQKLQSELADFVEAKQKLEQVVAALERELALSREEVALQTEELQAAEQDLQQTMTELQEERAQHKSAIHTLQTSLKEAEIISQTSLEEAALVASNATATNREVEDLREQVAALESALNNAKMDYQGALDELEVVNARFDEARAEAELAGRDAAAEELRASMRTDDEHEINQVKETLGNLSAENEMLQQKVDALEVALAAAKGRQDGEGSELQIEFTKQLQTLRTRSKEELAKKDKEMAILTSTLESRMIKAEEQATHLEGELHSVRGQLAEAEGHLIVLRKDKERYDNMLSKSPKFGGKPTSPRKSSKDLPSSEELDAMELSPSPSKSRGRSSSPSSVMRLEIRLAEEEKKYASLEKDYNEVHDQKRMGEVRIRRLEDDIKLLQKQLFERGSDATTVTQMSRLSSLGSAQNGMDVMSEDEVSGRRLQEIIESRDIKAITEEIKSLEKQCNSQRVYNAQLLSKMLHLQGNIQVYCRVRPMTLSEIQKGFRCVVEPLSETEVGCFDERTNKWKSFAFDRVWGPDQSQTSVFQDVEPLALSVVDGFNACIFAYGQTGSGKTYTMEGLQENNQFGISYRTIQKIFHLLNLRTQQQRTASVFVGSEDSQEEVAFTFSLKVGMLEIYNDEIYDLLATSGASMLEKKQEAMKAGGKASLEIRRDKDGRVEVPNLTQETVSSIHEVMAILKRGNSNRATAATDLNEHSSRSHMVLMVDVTSGLDKIGSNKGTLYLVDLAGSERVRKSHVDGEHLKEAGYINKSLAALGNVMEALDRKAKHIPYRDSKLTALLQNSLGGNSRTMMVVATCPMDNSYDESVHALQFATRVRRIQIGAAQRNVTSKNLEETVKKLTDEMKALSRAKERTEDQLHSLKRDNDRVQDKLQNLSKARSQGRSDNKTMEVLRKNNDEMAARWLKEKTAREETSEELDNSRKELRLSQQQLTRYKSKLQQVEQKLDDKEEALERATEKLRQERNHMSASTLRTRRNEVLSSRARPPVSERKPSNIPLPSPSKTSPLPSRSTNSITPKQPVTGQQNGEPTDVAYIRSQVLTLLEKYDKAKVDRIDIIMEKFNGKEALLLEKMTQRYEDGSARTTASFQSRNALALKRHHERMASIREKRNQEKANGLGR